MSDDPNVRFAQAVKGSDVAAPAPSVALRLNTHATGFVGLLAGSTGLSGVIAAVWTLFHLLSDPQFLFDLIGEHDAHVTGPRTAALVAALFGVAGSVIIALLGLIAAWLGRPTTVPR